MKLREADSSADYMCDIGHYLSSPSLHFLIFCKIPRLIVNSFLTSTMCSSCHFPSQKSKVAPNSIGAEVSLPESSEAEDLGPFQGLWEGQCSHNHTVL